MTSTSKLTGWQRLGIVLSVLWLVLVGIKATGDYEDAANGGRAHGFAVFKDATTGRTYSYKSRIEVGKILNLEELDAMIQGAGLTLGHVIKGPSGLKYKWNEPTPPTPDDVAAIQEYELNLSKTSPPKIKGAFDPDAYLAGVTTKWHSEEPVIKSEKSHVDLLAEFELPANTAIKRVVVSLDIGDLMLAAVLPLLCFWVAFFAIGWVVAGFRRTQNQTPV